MCRSLNQPNSASSLLVNANVQIGITLQSTLPYCPHILWAATELEPDNALRLFLEQCGYIISTVESGSELLEKLEYSSADLVIVNRDLPSEDSFVLCTNVRERSFVPLVMLADAKLLDDLVLAFEHGADDYIWQTCTLQEIEARLNVKLRRAQPKPATPELPSGAFTLHEHEPKAIIRGKTVHLTPIEYRLIRHIMTAEDHPMSKGELSRLVWGYETVQSVNFIEVAIRRLRGKIEPNPSEPEFLTTIRGAGYKFNVFGR